MRIDGRDVTDLFDPPARQILRSLGTPRPGSSEEAMCQVIEEVTGRAPYLAGGTRFLHAVPPKSKEEVIEKTSQRLGIQPKQRLWPEPDLLSGATINDVVEYYFGD